MSRRSNIRKRVRRKERFRSSRELAPPVSVITGETASAFQTPMRSEVRKISTASLIEEIQRRPEAQALLAAIAEANRETEA
jgi:hypothetical protein